MALSLPGDNRVKHRGRGRCGLTLEAKKNQRPKQPALTTGIQEPPATIHTKDLRPKGQHL